MMARPSLLPCSVVENHRSQPVLEHDRQRLGVGEGLGTVSEEAFPRALVAGDFGDLAGGASAPVSAAAFRLILLTAQRPGEVFRMRWQDIEDAVWWIVPAEVAKNGEANRVYLSPQARAILDDLHPHTGGSGWVLESPLKPGTHLTTIQTANRGILGRTEMRPWSAHDLRRTAASKMRALGVDRLVVQGILNHKDRSVTAVYDRYSLDPEKQRALCDWGRRVEWITGGEPGAQVVGFRRRGSARGCGGERSRPDRDPEALRAGACGTPAPVR